MTASIINGKIIADSIKKTIAKEIEEIRKKGLPIPGLAVILVGNDSASEIYVHNKRLACQEVGLASYAFDLPSNTTQETLLSLIEQLNTRSDIAGILVQLPLPKQIDSATIIERIRVEKDVDGFHPYNLGRLAQQCPLLHPCTPLGIITMLKHINISMKGMNAVVVGASNIVGRPMALELLNAGATVTICHKYTRQLSEHVSNAELLIVAIGKRDIIKSEWIKEGAVVIDVGMHRLSDGSLAGDIDFATAKERASWITPVPGGVGPMTVATLLQNTLIAGKLIS
jgi:methylenetetrahydrofolate dehydrogenase (NADP+)/methenyltetrahydrofolate cyclohydrolase